MLLYLQMLETPEEKSLFEQICLEYRGLMYHVAYEILHNDQDAEDAVHQAFVKIVENIKKIDDPVCPKTHGYVVTIVEHQAIDQYRKRQKYQTVELIEEIQGTNAHYEGDNDLTKCILQLPARYREMILLRYHYGYTVREIAISFDGTTANCRVSVSADRSTDQISAVIQLWNGSTRIARWTDSGTGYLLFSNSATVSKGKTYELTVDVKINGVSKPQVSIEGTCK